jgi:hypothetical protein
MNEGTVEADEQEGNVETERTGWALVTVSRALSSFDERVRTSFSAAHLSYFR